MYLFELWFSLDICPGVGLQDHIVALLLVFKGTSILFSIMELYCFLQKWCWTLPCSPSCVSHHRYCGLQVTRCTCHELLLMSCYWARVHEPIIVNCVYQHEGKSKGAIAPQSYHVLSAYCLLMETVHALSLFPRLTLRESWFPPLCR